MQPHMLQDGCADTRHLCWGLGGGSAPAVLHRDPCTGSVHSSTAALHTAVPGSVAGEQLDAATRGASPAVLGAPCCPGAVQGRCWHWGAGRVTGCACQTLLDYEQQLALRSCSNRNQVCSRTFWAGSRDSGQFVWNLLLSTHQARGCDTSQEAVTWVLVAVGCGLALTLTPSV